MYQASIKLEVGKMKLRMGALEEHNCACAPTIQSSTINHQYSSSLQDGGILHRHKIFKELLQTLTRNSQSQTNCANSSGAFPTSNLIDHIQLPRDIHEILSNGAPP